MSSTFDADIDHEYMPTEWSPRKDTIDIFVQKGEAYSSEIRAKLSDYTEIVQYGEGPQQLLDIVRPNNVNEETPILFYIHGGYWVLTSRDLTFYVMKCTFDREWIGVNVGYDQAPNVSLTTIVNQIRDAFIFISKKFPKSQQVTVSGHSAGGQLSAMLLATDWAVYYPEERIIPITRCVPISGIHDVRPTRHIRYNEQLQLTEQETKDLSPILQIKIAVSNMQSFGTKVISVVGEHDPPSFRRMSKEYAEVLQAGSVDTSYVEIKGVDHFEIIEKLYEDNNELQKLLLGGEERDSKGL